jgi:hypothetical protein
MTVKNDPKDNVDVTADDELSEEMLGDVSGGTTRDGQGGLVVGPLTH